MPLDFNNADLHSDEVQDILGSPPAWLVRWGTGVVVTVLGGLIALGWVTKYPDIVPSEIVISTPFPPALVVTRQEGRVAKLLVDDSSMVKKGDPLMVIENTAADGDIKLLERYLQEIDGEKPRRIIRKKPPQDLELGNLQRYFSDFMMAFDDYKMTARSSYDSDNIDQLYEQIESTEDLSINLKKQQMKLSKELRNAKTNYDRLVELKKTGGASEIQVEQAHNDYIARQRMMDNMDREVISNEIQISRLRKQITDIKKNVKETGSVKSVRLRESIDNLESQIEEWKQNFLLTAPIDGMVAMNKRVEENMYIPIRTEVMTILPSKNELEETIGEIAFNQGGRGKIKIGQDVNVKLHDFPFKEYGIIKGKVKSISPIPRKGVYFAEISFPDGLTTTYKKKIPFQQEAGGVAEIIADDKRFLERIFEQLREPLSREYPVPDPDERRAENEE